MTSLQMYILALGAGLVVLTVMLVATGIVKRNSATNKNALFIALLIPTAGAGLALIEKFSH